MGDTRSLDDSSHGQRKASQRSFLETPCRFMAFVNIYRPRMARKLLCEP